MPTADHIGQFGQPHSRLSLRRDRQLCVVEHAQPRSHYRIIEKIGHNRGPGRPGFAIDPLDVDTLMFHGFVLFFARRYDDALFQANEIQRLQPGHLATTDIALKVAHMQKRYADAIAAAATSYEAVGLADVAEALGSGMPNRATRGRGGGPPKWSWRSMEPSQASRSTPR
jgi:hypothetical protein